MPGARVTTGVFKLRPVEFRTGNPVSFGPPKPASRVCPLDNIPTGLQLARLTILRSKLGDTQAERQAVAAGTFPEHANRDAHRLRTDLNQDRI